MNLWKSAFLAMQYKDEISLIYYAQKPEEIIRRKILYKPRIGILKSFRISSCIWALAVLIWVKKCTQLALLVHFAISRSSPLEEKERGLFFGRKQHGSFPSQKGKLSGQLATAALWKQEVMETIMKGSCFWCYPSKGEPRGILPREVLWSDG